MIRGLARKKRDISYAFIFVGLCKRLRYITAHSQYMDCLGETMATTKTATLTFRIEPGLKEVLRIAAEQEHRSIANMVEVMIREYCGRNKIAVPVQNSSATTGGVRTIKNAKPGQKTPSPHKNVK